MMQNKTFLKLIVNLFNSLNLTHDVDSVDTAPGDGQKYIMSEYITE
jgi:hypothetical protein